MKINMNMNVNKITKISKKKKKKYEKIISSVIILFFSFLLINGTININRKKKNEDVKIKNLTTKLKAETIIENSENIEDIEKIKDIVVPIFDYEKIEIQKRKVIGDYINFRKEPIVDPDNIIYTISKNEIVELLEENLGTDKKWVKIKYKDNIGYVVSEYLTTDININNDEKNNTQNAETNSINENNNSTDNNDNNDNTNNNGNSNDNINSNNNDNSNEQNNTPPPENPVDTNEPTSPEEDENLNP